MPQKPQQPDKKPDVTKAKSTPEQDLYDIFVSQGIKIASEISGSLQGKASIDTLGNALYDIVKKIETEGSKNGIQFPLSVLLHGSNEILGYLLDVSEVKVTEDQTKGIIGIAVGKYIQDALNTGKMTKDQLGNLAKQAQQTMTSQQQPQQPVMGTGGIG
jgi:hypothetical protein